MALPAGTVWEVRTAGADTNGGGNVPKKSLSDLVVDASLNTKITSTSYNFVAGDVGSNVTIVGGPGWTPGVYVIDSVASNAATLHTSPAPVNSVHGVGYVHSGLDYSQQDSANPGSGNNQSTTDAAATGTTTITSATAAFTAAIVGNIIYLQGGTGSLAAGWYQVASFTNSTTIVLDRAVASGTGITMNVGGALLTIAKAIAVSVASNVVWLKAGTYTQTATLTISLVSGSDTPWSLIGYQNARGDSTGTRPLITTATNSTVLFTLNTSPTQVQGVLFRNLSLSNTAATRADGFNATGGIAYGVHIDNCVLDGFQIGINGPFVTIYSFYHLLVEGTEIKNCVSHGILNKGGTILIEDYIHANGGDGFQQPTAAALNGGLNLIAIRTTFWANNRGISDNQQSDQTNDTPMVIVNCNIGGSTGDGIFLNYGSTAGGITIVNTIFDANGGYDVDDNSTKGPAWLMNRNNAYHTTGTGARLNFPPGRGDVVLTGSPFTAPASGDFSLNGTAGAGAACKTVGFNKNWA